MRPSLDLILRLAFALVILGYLFWKIDPRDVWQTARGLSFAPAAAALVLLFTDRVLMALRWLLLLRPLDRSQRPPFAEVLRIFFVSTFVGTFLPASIGVDTIRAYSLTRQNVAGAEAVASVIMDRVLGTLAIFLVGAAGLLAVPRLVAPGLLTLSVALAAFVTLGTVLVLYSRTVLTLAERLIDRLPWARVTRLARSLLGAVQNYSRFPGPLLQVLALSILVQVVRVGQTIALGQGLGIAAGPAVYFAYVPAIMLLMLLPIGVAGLGVSQVGFVWCFAHVGVPEAQSLALSLLFAALAVVGNLPGGILFVWGRRR